MQQLLLRESRLLQLQQLHMLKKSKLSLASGPHPGPQCCSARCLFVFVTHMRLHMHWQACNVLAARLPLTMSRHTPRSMLSAGPKSLVRV